MKLTLASALLVAFSLPVSGCASQAAIDHQVNTNTARKAAETTVFLDRAAQELRQDEEWHTLIMHICRTGWPWLASLLAGGLGALVYIRIRRVEVDRLRAETELRLAEARLAELQLGLDGGNPPRSVLGGSVRGDKAGAGNGSMGPAVERMHAPAAPDRRSVALARSA